MPRSATKRAHSSWQIDEKVHDATIGVVDLDPRLGLTRRPADPRPCCRPAGTAEDFGRASRCAGHIVSYLDCQGGLHHPGPFRVRLRRLLRRDHCAPAGGNCRPFLRPKFGCRDRPALHEFRAWPARRPRGVRVLGRLLEQRFDCKLHGYGLLGRSRLFLRNKTASTSTTSTGHLLAPAAPYANTRLYRVPAFGAADRLIAGEGCQSRCRTLAAQIAANSVTRGPSTSLTSCRWQPCLPTLSTLLAP